MFFFQFFIFPIIVQEKLDFLEEHSEQLVHEVKKKNKIIHAYIQNIEPGALISEESDIHKVTVTFLINFYMNKLIAKLYSLHSL